MRKPTHTYTMTSILKWVQFHLPPSADSYALEKLKDIEAEIEWFAEQGFLPKVSEAYLTTDYAYGPFSEHMVLAHKLRFDAPTGIFERNRNAFSRFLGVLFG